MHDCESVTRAFEILISGVIATLAMNLVMSIINWRKIANADMVRALGSLVTRNYRTALMPGLVIHFTFGILFAFIYAKLISFAPVEAASAVVLLTLTVGVFHGMAVGFFLAIVVAEHHPLPEFRRVGLRVVLAHLAGHITYGLTLGLLFVAIRLNFLHFIPH